MRAAIQSATRCYGVSRKEVNPDVAWLRGGQGPPPQKRKGEEGTNQDGPRTRHLRQVEGKKAGPPTRHIRQVEAKTGGPPTSRVGVSPRLIIRLTLWGLARKTCVKLLRLHYHLRASSFGGVSGDAPRSRFAGVRCIVAPLS